MATPVLKELGEHVMRKLHTFRPLREKLKSKEAHLIVAKYLGKSGINSGPRTERPAALSI